MKNQLCRAAIAVAGFALCLHGEASAQLRIVNYNIAQLNGNQSALQNVFAELNADDWPGFADAPHLYLFQEVQNADVTPLLNMLNAAAPPGIVYAKGTYTNSGEDGTAGAQAMFYRTDTLSEDVSAHLDIYTQAGRYADRWKLNLLGYSSSDASFYVYSTHLKASTGSSNEATRLTGATAIRNNADALPAGTHILYCGDWNVYNNSEPAYLKFISAGNGQAFDPYGTGYWGGSANAWKHTQSPNSGGLVTGGMDDRFDFQLGTAAFNDADGLSLIADTYRPLGNDGNHYDQAINVGTNSFYIYDIPRSDALADELATASDHCPLVADYQIPAVLSATLPANFGRVIVGTPVSVTLSVENAADVITTLGADLLDYSAAVSGSLGGSASGSIAALTAPATHALPVNTSTAGNKSGGVLLTSTSEAVANSPLALSCNGTVIRAANASFESADDVQSYTVTASAEPDSGLLPLSVPVYNRGYDSAQALLDIDNVTTPDAPFVLEGGLTTGIGAQPATLDFSFDTAGMSSGSFSTLVGITVSDEDIPGESNTLLTLTLTVNIGGSVVGDMNCDGATDVFDIDAFVLALTDQVGYEMAYPECARDRADVNTDGLVDVFDIDAFVDLISGH